MRISVIIPTYNRPSQTCRAITSAVAQTYPIHEVVVVDDASHPPADRQSFETIDPRVKVHILSSNQGAAATRQTAIDLSTGDVLAFLDSDDVWHPEKLERQMPLLLSSRDQLVAVSCGWKEVAGNGMELKTRIPVEAKSPMDFLSGCWFCPGSTVIMSRLCFDRVGPFASQLRRLEDFEWFIRFGLAGGRLIVLPEAQAAISVGARARLKPVKDAAERITHNLLDHPIMTPSMQATVRSWLSVELARAALNERRVPEFLLYIASSLRRRPRLSVQLRQWWR